MKIKSLYDKVYFAEVLMLVGTYKEYEKWLEKKGLNPTESEKLLSAASFKMDTKTNGVMTRKYVIWLSEKKDFYSLLHEVLHTVFKILSDRGIKYDPENHEPYCYYVDFWFKKLWRYANKS